jgi:membrane protein YdbS with pleckstrin-like domain
MFERHLTKNLKEGEEVLRYVRRSGWSVFFPAVVAAVVLLSPFFFLFPLLRLGPFGVVAIVVLLVVGVVIAVRVVVMYSFNVLMITTIRLIDIDQRGLFHREVSESTYEKIQDVSFSMKGIAQTVFRFGNLLIQTAGGQANLEQRNIREPEKVQDLILKLQSEYQKHDTAATELSAEELLQIVKRLKEGLGEETFKKLTGRS